MPFPTNGSYPVLGCSRPGEAAQSKPKRAIIVRMSPEALKALEDFPKNPPMEFEFGENPGIHIGHQHFNINAVEEPALHDLYLRASSATKKNPPFKLHANVMAKFTVQRELLPSVGEKVRESTNEAIAQRASRTTLRIDDTKALNIENQRQKQAARQSQKKKKVDGASITGVSASRSNGSSLLDKAKNKAVASAERTGTVKAASNPLDRLSPERVQDIKRRLIHFLAPEDRSQDEVVRAIGGTNLQPQSRQAICHLLEEVGEPVGKAGSKYRLKPRSWKDLRPHEWDKWTESVRTKVCREGRQKLSQMGILESDPLWAHFEYRRPTGNNGYASPSSSSAQAAGRRGTPEPKRPLMSSDFREKEKDKAAAIRAKGKGEIKAKDESRSVSRSGRESPSEISRVASSSSSSTGAARKQPGTGFKAPSSKLSNDITRDTTPSRKTDMRPPATTGRDSPSASSVRSDSQTNRPAHRNRERAGSVQDSDTERRRANQVHQSSKLAQRPKVEDDYQDSDVERRRQKRQADKEREREQRAREKEKEREWEREEKEKAREKERREREREKEKDRREREKERERTRESDRERGRRDRDWSRANGRDRDSERDKPSRLKELKREKEEGETSDASNASVLKRKARPVEDDDEYQPSKASAKRRKADPLAAGLPPKPKVAYPESRHERSYSRQSDVSDSKRIKRESPLPPPLRASPSSLKRARSPVPSGPNKRVSVSASRDGDVDSRSGSLKPKKNYKQANSDMIYTDSSDSDSIPRHRDELPQTRTTSTTQRRADPVGKLPEMPTHPSKFAPASHESSAARHTLTPLHSNGNGRVSSHYNDTSRPHERLTSLQREYEKKFYAYDELWRAMDAQQRTIKRLLRELKSGVDSVSEDDDAVMDIGEVERGVNKLRRMADELVPLDMEIRHLRSTCANGGSSD